MTLCYDASHRHFSEANIKAIDQTWYKRAVDHYEVDPESFVYSVPFDAGTKSVLLINNLSNQRAVEQNDYMRTWFTNETDNATR